MTPRPWKSLARRRRLSRPPWLEVGEERVALPDGREIDGFPWIRTRDFAIAVALTEDERVIVERSYRHGVRAVALSLPAGYLEAGEDPLAAAKRELREETGYEADTWTPLGSYVVDGNYGVGAEHAFLARGARRTTQPASNDLEETELLFMPLNEVLAALRRGEIAQLASAAALGLAVLALEPL